MKKRVLQSAMAIVAVIFLAACSKKTCANSEKATFRDLTGLDGCGIVVELSDGKRLEPMNLNDFNIEVVDGKKLWVNYHLAQNGGSICMVGDIVEIECISER